MIISLCSNFSAPFGSLRICFASSFDVLNCKTDRVRVGLVAEKTSRCVTDRLACEAAGQARKITSANISREFNQSRFILKIGIFATQQKNSLRVMDGA